MKYLPTQSEAIQHLATKKVGALFKAPGTGKTRAAVELIKQVDTDYVLWLAPYRSVFPKLEGSGIISEVNKWYHFDNIDFIGIESVGMSDRIYLEVRSKLKEAANPFIVVDESLLIKNAEAKRTERILELSELSTYKLILNGTPFSRNLLDLWAQMQFLSPKILNMGLTQFENTFCKKTIIKKRDKVINEYITGYENVDYLYHLIRPFIYEAELVLDVDVEHIYNAYEVDAEMKAEYTRVKEHFLCDESLDEYNNNIFLMMVQKMQHTYCCASEKVEIVKEIIKVHGIDKVAIYTKFIDSRTFLKEQIKGCHVFSLQSESMSINLQDQFNVTIEFDKTWDWKDVDQYQRRVFRTGQKEKVFHYYLDAKIPLDTLIKKNNDKKQSALDYFKQISKEELKEEL